MNSWDDQKVRDALKANGRNKVIVSGLWTEVCNNTFALCAMLEGNYEIYMVADASGGTSKEAHDYAMQRMIQAGVVPVTWQQVLLEWQRDWAHRDTYDAVMKLVKEHSGAYGMGVDYAYTMVHKAAQRTLGARSHRPGTGPLIKTSSSVAHACLPCVGRVPSGLIQDIEPPTGSHNHAKNTPRNQVTTSMRRAGTCS